jgi:hypothetical protein
MESSVVWTVDFRNSLVLSCRKKPPETTEANTMIDLGTGRGGDGEGGEGGGEEGGGVGGEGGGGWKMWESN